MSVLVGISSGRRMVPSTKGETRATVLYTTYSDMIREAGGVPVILTPGAADEAPKVIARLDGLLLSGGGDVDPLRYGGTIIPSLYDIDPQRDEYELALSVAARDARLPTLAICRGMQVMDVALGGTLIEDIPSEDLNSLPHQVGGPGTVETQHDVAVEPDSRVAAALGTAHLAVNSIHHQAVRSVGTGLRIVGRSPDGIVEAMEWQDDDWLLWCVQWHPEYLGRDDVPSMNLFRSFVQAISR